MLNSSPPIKFRFHAVLLTLLAIGFLVGCSHDKLKRGHIFRCAFEYNRTPWDGCPPDSGCDGEEASCSKEDCQKCSAAKKGLFGCFKKGNDESPSDETKKNKGFRRHCGLNPECTAKNPCCRSLGCGMWIDPSDPNSFATVGTGIKACGLTPFCSPMKPCGLTPNCGRTANQNAVNPNYANQQFQQTLMFGNNGSILPGMQPAMPTPILPKRTIETQPSQPGQPNPMNQIPNPKTPTLAGPNGLLISMGIVPGISTITTGGVVAAAGVVTPVGMMTPAGVRLPSGVVNPNVVIKTCGITPGCSAARPCGMTPGCGMMIPVNMVSNNAVMLASALQVPGVAGGVLQTGGASGMMGVMPNSRMGNPMMNQTMNGISQTDYITDPRYVALAESGYKNIAGMIVPDEEEEEEIQPEVAEADIKAKMPLPRFHPVPTKPVFQRSEGLPILPGTGVKKPSDAGKVSGTNSKRIFSEESLNDAMEQAYLEGMSAAMEKVEEELDAKSEALTAQSEEDSKVEMQEKILEQAQKLQAKIEKQKELEQQLYQESLRKEAQIQARRAAEQKIVEQQTIEEKNARRLAAREQAIRAEAAQQLAERERIIREEAARELAVQEQALQAQLEQQSQLLEAARIQQVRMTQAQMNSRVALANQPVQPMPGNGMNLGMSSGMSPMSNGKSMFTSAIDFLKGNDQRIPPQPNGYPMMTPVPQYVASRPMMPPQSQQQLMPQNGTPVSNFGFYQSAKSAGTNFLSTLSGTVSPLSGLFGSDMPSTMVPAMRQQPEQVINRSMPVSAPLGTGTPVMTPAKNQLGTAINHSASSSSQSMRSVRQSGAGRSPQSGVSAPQNFSLTQTMPIPQLHGDHAHMQRDCPDCLPTRSSLVDMKPQMSKKRVPFPSLGDTEETTAVIAVPEIPRKPPTMAKSKKVIDVDDEPMIRQARFEDRDGRR